MFQKDYSPKKEIKRAETCKRPEPEPKNRKYDHALIKSNYMNEYP